MVPNMELSIGMLEFDGKQSRTKGVHDSQNHSKTWESSEAMGELLVF